MAPVFTLFLIIFLEGYVVLSTELLAIRLLLPFTGSGTDTVSIIIAAILMPLAFGYFAGGLTGDSGLNHRTPWTAQPGAHQLADGQKTLEVRFSAQGKDGLAATKIYRFHRDSYTIDVVLEVTNAGTAPVSPATYFQFTHDGKPSGDANTVAATFGAQSFNGFAAQNHTPTQFYYRHRQLIPPCQVVGKPPAYSQSLSDFRYGHC